MENNDSLYSFKVELNRVGRPPEYPQYIYMDVMAKNLEDARTQLVEMIMEEILRYHCTDPSVVIWDDILVNVK